MSGTMNPLPSGGVDSPAAPPSVSKVLADLWRAARLEPAALQRFSGDGSEPAVRSSFAIGTALQAALGAAALAGTEVARQRDGVALPVRVDKADVLSEAACRFTLDGRSPQMWDPLSGLYRCTSGGGFGATQPWVRVHANFAHHRDGVLALLGLPIGPTIERPAVEEALRRWRAQDFERAAAEQGLVVAALRHPAQWAAHPQAEAVTGEPLVEIRRSGQTPALGWPRGAAADPQAGPLAGLRVLELTRILAGPVAGRTLAAQGADVLLINGPHLPNIDALAETSQGKRSALLDLRTPAGQDTLRQLVRECDVFLQSYRPGALAALGFGADELERLRPGLVSVSLSAYGTRGPWGGRRGFDSLVQSTTGINLAEAQAFGQTEPRALPVQALDYGAGYLLAFGALAGVLRQRQRGGSWRVKVSLAGVSHWLQRMGRIDDPTAAPALEVESAWDERASGFGLLRAVRHAVQIDGRRLRWALPSMPPGTHAPVWADPA